MLMFLIVYYYIFGKITHYFAHCKAFFMNFLANVANNTNLCT